MKRKLLVAVPLLCLVALLAWYFRPKHETLGEAFISERSVTLWSSVAQVREPVGTLHYGDRVDVLAQRNDNTKVRTAAGTGWVDARFLMKPALWQRSAALLEQACAQNADQLASRFDITRKYSRLSLPTGPSRRWGLQICEPIPPITRIKALVRLARY